MSAHLAREIQKVQKLLLNLAAMVEDLLTQSIIAVDTGNEPLAQQIIQSDQRIDLMENQIEEECLKMLALYQPVAQDLRFVVACLKVNNDLERIADMACNIACRVQSAMAVRQENLPVNFIPMAQEVQRMLKMSLDALFQTDKELARKVCKMDREVDEMNRRHTQNIIQIVREKPIFSEPLIYLLGVSRNLERIADCCTNIAEDIIYMIDGNIVRHTTGAK